MLLIYTHTITHRNKYIFNLLFTDILGVDTTLTSDEEKLKAFDGAKISYTHNPIGDELFFTSRNLLFETGINDQNISVFDVDNSKAFFSSPTLQIFSNCGSFLWISQSIHNMTIIVCNVVS